MNLNNLFYLTPPDVRLLAVGMFEGQYFVEIQYTYKVHTKNYFDTYCELKEYVEELLTDETELL